MRYLSPIKCGIVLGAVIGLWHLAWATLVMTQTAQPVLDFVLSLHFIQFSYVLTPFGWSTAATLIGLTFGVGFVLGAIFAVLWNWMAKPRSSAVDG